MNRDIRQGDARQLITELPDSSIDFCLTDPPYFLDALGDDWNTDTIEQRRPVANSTIKNLPKGMKFDPEQGRRFQEFMEGISAEVLRVLKPGGFFVCFSQARLYHRLAVAVEDSGFEMRDMLGWTYQGQAKAFSQDHIIDRQKDLSDQEKAKLKQELEGWKTPQLKPCIEPMCLAQKPLEGKFIDNWQKWGVGLVNTQARWQDQFPGNIIPCAKPSRREKGAHNVHVTVKPVDLCAHLVRLFTQKGQTVLDPFLGSGTTMLAAEQEGRNSVGFELSKDYVKVVESRINDLTHNGLFEWGEVDSSAQ